MGQTASVPSTPFLGTPCFGTPKLGRSKQKKDDGVFVVPDDAPPLPSSSTWRPRRSKAKRNQQDETRQFLAEAARDQKEVVRLLTEARLEGRSCTPRLVTGDDDDDLEGLAIRVGGRKLSRDDPVLPPLELHETLEALHEQFKLASLAHSTSSSSGNAVPLSRTKSAPSRPQSGYLAPPARQGASSSSRDGASPTSAWSDSSVGVPSPHIPFETFRNSLNFSQLNRLSHIAPPAPPASAATPSPTTLSAPSTPRTDTGRSSTSSRGFSLLPRRKKRSKSVRERGPIVVVEAHRVGSGRYSMLKEAADAAALTRRMSEAERKASISAKQVAEAAHARGRKASTCSIDVWESSLPIPGRRPTPLGSPDLALSPRFSTTPATLSSIYRTAPESAQADARKLNRASWIVLDSAHVQRRRSSNGLAAYIAASPKLTCASEEDEIFVDLVSTPPVAPAPAPVESRLPGSHPASYHSRFAHLPPPPPVPPLMSGRRASTSSLLTIPRQQPVSRRRSSVHTSTFLAKDNTASSAARGRRRSSYRISVVDIDEESYDAESTGGRRRASMVSLATTSNSADQAIVSRAIAVRRRSRLGSVAETSLSSPASEFPLPFGRPATMYSQHSGLSFPRSVGDDVDSPAIFPFHLPQPSPGGFFNYSMSQGAAMRTSFADSIAPETVDAFPLPPPLPSFPSRIVPPTPLDLSSHRSLEANLSSPASIDASTPSSASFDSTSVTSQSSIELLGETEAVDNVLAVDFTDAGLGQAPTYAKVRASPALSQGSVATFVLDDLITSLAGETWSPEGTGLPIITTEDAPVHPGRPKGRLSLEQPDFLPSHLAAPPLPLSLPPRSPPRFLSTFSFNPAPSALHASGRLAPISSPTTHPLNDGVFDSPFLFPRTPELPSPSGRSGYRFPASPSQQQPAGDGTWTTLPGQWNRASAADALFSAASTAPLEVRRGTFPEFVPPSRRAKERSLFDALLARSALEEEEAVMVQAVPGRETRLGSADKRGFSKNEISSWLATARRESETVDL
ncbi:hypothetical protein JCM8547_006019 [Rhodosporidiobolus lusitaniae]